MGAAMNTYAIYFHPRGPLASEIGSDTLFGAICWGMAALGEDAGALLNDDQKAPFVCSGVFPAYFLPGETIRFYPRPLTFDALPQTITRAVTSQKGHEHKTHKTVIKEATGKHKELRQVKFVSEAVLKEILAGTLTLARLVSSWIEERDDYTRIGNLLATRVELREWPYDTLARREKRYRPLLERTETQHNQIDRITGSTGEGLLFYQSETFFSEQGGLWALVRAENDVMNSSIRPALRYLSDSGLGANRSSGKGQFDFVVDAGPELPDAGGRSNAFLSLSRYLCVSGEWGEQGPLAYQLTSLWPKREQKYPLPSAERAQYPVYKRRVRMFEPGSVFPLAQRRDYFGQLSTVVDAEDGGWPVKQSGFTLPIFLRIEEQAEGVTHGNQ